MESIKEGINITFRLIDFICDNVDFENLNADDIDDIEEINNFYGIVYHWIVHCDMVHFYLNNQNAPIQRELYVNQIRNVFSTKFKNEDNKNQEAPYWTFWDKLKNSNNNFLQLLSKNDKISAKNCFYAQKLSEILDKLKVAIQINNGEISVQDKNNSGITNQQNKIKPERNKYEGNDTKKSKFPKWAKYLIGLGILAVAVLALLFGFGVLGALADIAKTVTLVISAR